MTPDDIYKLDKPSKGFLCPLSANSYDLVFKSFEIADYDSKNTLFDSQSDSIEVDPVFKDNDDLGRGIRYKFPEDVLKLPRIATFLTFVNGDQPLSNFRLIERHYFRDDEIRTYDFNFGFVIPNSTNTWEAVYETPSFSQYQIDQIVANPHQTKSDTFYFVGEELVMHHKVSYAYVKGETDCTESKHYEAGEDRTEEVCEYQSEAKDSDEDPIGNSNPCNATTERKDWCSKDTGF